VHVSYEWDPAKAQATFAKHGVRFADAVTVLEDDLALTMRDPFSEEEERWITLGKDALGRILVVIYTWRGESVRLMGRTGRLLSAFRTVPARCAPALAGSAG
jgi:uncharacterized DUF497 family protein